MKNDNATFFSLKKYTHASSFLQFLALFKKKSFQKAKCAQFVVFLFKIYNNCGQTLA